MLPQFSNSTTPILPWFPLLLLHSQSISFFQISIACAPTCLISPPSPSYLNSTSLTLPNSNTNGYKRDGLRASTLCSGSGYHIMLLHSLRSTSHPISNLRTAFPRTIQPASGFQCAGIWSGRRWGGRRHPVVQNGLGRCLPSRRTCCHPRPQAL